MRFQKGMIGVIAALSIVIASGCAQESKIPDVSQAEASKGSTNSSTDKIGSTTILYTKEFSQERPDLSNFKEGVSFDLSDHVKDFFTQDISDKVQNNMKAIIQHDEKKFKENMLDEESVKFNMHWFNYKYEAGVKFEFKEVNTITYEQDAKRIQVVATFLRNIKDEEIEQEIMTYSLLEDKDKGTWLIATMDGN
ncbi:hypothetical protein GCM10010912_00930 [Paenibacillus albidus]|uniref:DUF4829 domain-containing protein n=1 Tax=Paenibacillus albidus TaxID=2041023 RepID=A0A917BWF6_9BACL|nr:hypothetical protein [Paenibacillus albidus]GGF59537.1 hypothetical protein GCM10010912_00930 [Paenibacillus albidus]